MTNYKNLTEALGLKDTELDWKDQPGEILTNAEQKIDPPQMPERDLIAAVVYRALHDLLDHHYEDAALEWFICEDERSDEGLTFLHCCDLLEWDAGAVLEKVDELVKWIIIERAQRPDDKRFKKIFILDSPLSGGS